MKKIERLKNTELLTDSSGRPAPYPVAAHALNGIYGKATLLKKGLLMLLALLGVSYSLAQAQHSFFKQEAFLKGNSHWAFGINAGIAFDNATGPTAFQSQLSANAMVGAGSAAVSDRTTGDLLFYSDGVTCYDRNHQAMPHGSGLSGTTVGSYFIAPQGTCIVPAIEDENEYYLFYLNLDSAHPALYYSIVDMTLNNGLGDVDSNRKDILVHEDHNSFGESMIAVPGDHCDIWLLSYAFEKAEFKAYHITGQGFDKTPVVSSTGQSVHSQSAYKYGALAISPDRSKIAFTDARALSGVPEDIDGVFIGKFDPATGQVSDVIKFNDKDYVGGYGIAFSPDNTKLYSFIVDENAMTHTLVQFDVSVFDSTAIIASKQTIQGPQGMYFDLSLRAYGDTIYVSDFYSMNATLGAITNPNLSGSACHYIADVVPFVSGTNASWGMGSDVVYTLKDTVTQSVDTFVCAHTTLALEVGSSASSDFIWDDGSTSGSRSVSDAGTYWVSYQDDQCTRKMDTFVVARIDLDPVININLFKLSTTQTYTTYQWMLNGGLISGATDSIYEVKQNGDYQVIVTNEKGCIDTSAVYKVTNYTGIGNVHALAGAIKAYPNPATDKITIQSPVTVNIALTDVTGRTVRQATDAQQVSLKDLAAGIYILRISNQAGTLIKVEKIVKQEE